MIPEATPDDRERLRQEVNNLCLSRDHETSQFGPCEECWSDLAAHYGAALRELTRAATVEVVEGGIKFICPQVFESAVRAAWATLAPTEEVKP